MPRSIKSLHGLGLPRWWVALVQIVLLTNCCRDLSGLELFDGRGEWMRGMQNLGFDFEGFDIASNNDHDLLKRSGIKACLKLLVRVKAKGIVNIGIPCRCWIWLTRSRHKRSKHCPQGLEQTEWVKQNNLLASVVSYIIVTCSAWGIHIIVENPKTSLLWYYKDVAEALFRVHAERFCISMGSFGGQTQKHLILMSTLPWMSELQWISRAMPKRHKDKRHLCKIYKRNNLVKVKGKNGKLASSAHYTYEYGYCCGKLWLGESEERILTWSKLRG